MKKSEYGAPPMRGRLFLKKGLRQLVQELPLNNAIMAEIGCYQGESTEIFCLNKKITKIYAIDQWENNYDDNDAASKVYPMEKVEKAFDERMKQYQNIVSKMKMTSEMASKDFENSSIDFVYIDGCHLYEFVFLDISLWLPKIKNEGFIAGHDYNHKQVKKAVNELLGEPFKTYIDGSWIFKK